MNEDDREALFNAWVGQHLALVGRVARGYADTEEDCQELVQEILLQVWLSIPRFERKAKPSTWIYRVALNTALAWQRRNERQRRRRFRPLVWAMDVATASSLALEEETTPANTLIGSPSLTLKPATCMVLSLSALL